MQAQEEPPALLQDPFEEQHPPELPQMKLQPLERLVARHIVDCVAGGPLPAHRPR